MSNLVLFLITTAIWGSTWLAISFQVHHIDEVLSVAFRFAIASLALGVWCLVKRISFRLPQHAFVKTALLGLFLYCLNYSLIYVAQQDLVSALVALMSSSIIYFNVVLRRLLLKKPMRREVVIGATLGLIGITLIFAPEFEAMSMQQGLALGIALATASFFCASVGNVISERILDTGIPVIQMNFWAMIAGMIASFSIAFFRGAELVLPTQYSYYWSLLYLGLFGSVFAFGAYMKLVQQIGSDKAAYVVLVYPIVALALSTLFEDYSWSYLAAAGVIVVLFGNAIAMGKLKMPTSTKRV